MSKHKHAYRDEIAAMFALSQCRKAGTMGNPNRKEKRIYKFKNKFYITSQPNKREII